MGRVCQGSVGLYRGEACSLRMTQRERGSTYIMIAPQRLLPVRDPGPVQQVDLVHSILDSHTSTPGDCIPSQSADDLFWGNGVLRET